MEDSMVAAYVALLLGYVVMKNEVIIQSFFLEYFWNYCWPEINLIVLYF